MLREGRLRRIKSYISPTNGNQSAGILLKFCCELGDEVDRLRGVVSRVSDSFEPEMDAQLACDERESVKACRNALKEPDLGPPGIICQRFNVLEKDESHNA